MSLIDMAAAFITASLAGTGIGGGGLFVIYLTMAKDFAQTDAQAVNLVFFIAAACASLPYHIRRRRLKPGVILICAALGCIGTLIGGTLRQSLPENAVRCIFGAMLIFVGMRSLFGKKKSREHGEKAHGRTV